jgi:hypothetical protein
MEAVGTVDMVRKKSVVIKTKTLKPFGKDAKKSSKQKA